MNSCKLEQNLRSTIICEKYTFSCDFDSGNLFKVELLKKNSKYKCKFLEMSSKKAEKVKTF